MTSADLVRTWHAADVVRLRARGASDDSVPNVVFDASPLHGSARERFRHYRHMQPLYCNREGIGGLREPAKTVQQVDVSESVVTQRHSTRKDAMGQHFHERFVRHGLHVATDVLVSSAANTGV